MATMNAVQVHKFGGPEVLEYSTNVPRPKPGPDEVLVRIKAAGVNPVDEFIATGTFVPPPLPYIPGMEFSGIIEEIGSNVLLVKEELT